MKRIYLLLFITLLTTATLTVFAHPGGTDGQGHVNHATGEYHYHHGYPEHQHTDGVCPYDFDDATGETSSSGNGNETPRIEKPQEEPEFYYDTGRDTDYDYESSDDVEENTFKDRFKSLPKAVQIIITVFACFFYFIIPIMISIFKMIIKKIKSYKQRKENNNGKSKCP